jgi:hypothetical protein
MNMNLCSKLECHFVWIDHTECNHFGVLKNLTSDV